MTVEEIRRENNNFPVGMRVLAVDDDPICLKLLETLLRKCQYHVTTTSQARMALKMLRENKDRFELVISDVHMPDMDGFKLLELVGLEMDLPVIMLSANSDPKLVMKGVTHGACDYLVKPIRIEELRNIWQHVLRRKRFDARNQNNKSSDQVGAPQASGEGHGSPVTGNNDQNGKFNRKRKDEEDDNDDNENENDDPATQKKPRVVWSIELHRKFVGAVNQLGIEKAVPKRILDLMNVDGLTRENVASHLQKYRLYLRRISSVASQQANMAAALGVRDSPFMRMGNSLDGLGDFRTLQQARLSNIALSSPFTSSNGMLGRLNSPSANINLRNLTQSSLVQPSHAQNLSNSITSLGKLNLVLSPSTQNPSLFQGIPSSLELDQMQQNKGPTNFNTIDSLLNGAPNNPMMLHGIGNQSTHSMSSFNSEGFNVSGSTNFLDPLNTFEASSRMQPNPLLSSSEPFHGHDSSNGSYLQSNPIDLFEDSREGFVGAVQRQNYPHSSGNGTFGSFNSSHVPGNGIVSPFVNGRSDGGASTTLMQQTENDKMAAETRMRSSNEDFLLEQPKLPGGFVPQGYDSLDELMNAMMKRDQDETISNCGFGFDDYSFGQGI